jgi:hypothetical protein
MGGENYMANNKPSDNKGLNPLAVGAAVIAGGVAGAAIATALSDKKTRQKLTDKVMELKTGAFNMIERMQDPSDQVTEKPQPKIIKVRSKTAIAPEADSQKKTLKKN